MNKWVFDSILPLLNKDVDILDNFESMSKKVECKCKICGKHFINKPLDLLCGKLHYSSGISNCQWSKNNKMAYCERETKKMIKVLTNIYNKYSPRYNFNTAFDVSSNRIELENKITGEIRYVEYMSELNNVQKNKKENGTTRNNTLKNKVYRFYDIKHEIVFNGTISELMEYCGKKNNCFYYKDIKKRKWFKKRFRLIRNNNKKHIDNSITYIRRKCKSLKQCTRYGNKCPTCLLVSSPFYTIDEFNKLSKEINSGFCVMSTFVDKLTPIKCQCLKCGYIFEKLPTDIINGIVCANCNSSKGEQLIMSYLDRKSIVYTKEKTFNDLKDKRNLRFDFYLNTYNAVIEYDGLQHFKPVMFHAKSEEEAIRNYEYIKLHDYQKDLYCKENNIPILRINYGEKDTSDRLEKFLSSLKRKSRTNKYVNKN